MNWKLILFIPYENSKNYKEDIEDEWEEVSPCNNI